MRSSKNDRVGPGNNNYGRGGQLSMQSELTPELSDKIWKAMQKRFYDEKVSKEHVLHHLKQLKAQVGKIRKQIGYQNPCTQNAFDSVLAAIDNKIAKIK